MSTSRAPSESAASDSHSPKAQLELEDDFEDVDGDVGREGVDRDWKVGELGVLDVAEPLEKGVEVKERLEGKGEGEEEEMVKRARFKLDVTVLPVMTLFYFLSFLDRANIGNARVAGLQTALQLTDKQYQICVTILYVPYVLSELPSNLILRTVGPNILMPAILTAWGLVVVFQGFVTSYEGLLAVRFLLGLLEGPMFSGIILYLSEGFYTRRELSLRISCFFSAASLSGAFSGLLAAAISKVDGLGGREGWAWIFILEGSFTVLVGLASFWLVPRTLQDAFWLTPAEKGARTRHLTLDRPSSTPTPFTPREITRALTSPHVLFLALKLFLGGTVLYGLALFLPSIVRQMGFGPVRSQVLSVGPFFGGFLVSLVAAWYSDKYNSRGVPIIVLSCVSIAGWAMFLGVNGKYPSYAALYLMVPGIYATSPISNAWVANNSEPYYRRASSIAVVTAAVNAGGILSTWRFPTKEGPKFRNTAVMMLVFTCVSLTLTLFNMLYLTWQNARKRRLRAEILAPYATEKEPDGGARAWVELGDRHPDFVYTL